MRNIVDGKKKEPHPEELAQRASRRTHGTLAAQTNSFPKLWITGIRIK
jgi:hypothetical protein